MTKLRHVLSFDLIVTPESQVEDYEGKVSNRAYLAVEARPLVNGQPLVESAYIFDTGSVLCRGLEPSEFNPFTCSCGVAECAGIWDSVHLEADEGLVRWVLPEEPYREKMQPTLQVEGEPLVLTFARDQYAAALAELEQRLLTLEKESGLPVVLLPDSHPELDETLEFALNRGKTNILAWIASERHRIAIFGQLLGQVVGIELSNGLRYTLSVSSLAYDKAGDMADERGISHQDALEQAVLPAFHASHAVILDAARALTWEQVESLAWQEGDVDSELPPEDATALAKAWADARLTLISENNTN